MGRGRAWGAWTRGSCVLSLLFATLIAAPSARAEPARIVDLLRVQPGATCLNDQQLALLIVQPGATCLNDQQLALQVERWLGDAPVGDDVSIVVDGSMFDPHRVRLYIVRDKRTVAHRAFEPGPDRCDLLHEAVGLAIAMVLKASRVEGEEPPPPPPVDRPALVPSEEPSRWSLAGAGLATYRLLPVLAAGLELSARYDASEHVRIRVAALGALALGIELDDSAGWFDATHAAARADACARTDLASALSGGLCLGLQGGFLYAAGGDVAIAQSAAVPMFALAAGAELELALSPRWSLALGLAATFLLHGVQVGVEDERGMRGTSRDLPSPGFALGLGPAYYFQ